MNRTLTSYGIPNCIANLVPASVLPLVTDAVATIDSTREAGTKRRANFGKVEISLGGSSRAKVSRGVSSEFVAWAWNIAKLQEEVGEFTVSLPAVFEHWFERLEQRVKAKATEAVA